ncbi:MAG: alpha/beta hydrolase [Ardenticatenaceae bacterium]|nr:alpha/beta hydrolase [Ardenticatenaceae bacterium]
MGKFKIGRLLTGALVLGGSALLVRVYNRFGQDLQAAEERLQSAGSPVLDTACGPIEYATAGQGVPVLVAHGIFGGFDQGLVIARGNIGEDFRIIAPSRFGYLNSPLPADASPAGQAAAYASLLDELGIERAAVVGTSAGGTSAIQFALRYPDRCAALVLFASNLPGEVEAVLPPEAAARTLFRSDFIFWLLTTYFRSNMKSIMGVPKGFELTAEFEAEVADVMETILPVNPRADGALFDMFVSNPEINSGYPLEKISVPTMIINAVDDPLALYENAQAAAARIPEARLVTIADGGHMMLGHEKRIRTEVASFLHDQVAARPQLATIEIRE